MSMQRVDAACDTRESRLRMKTKEARMKAKGVPTFEQQ